MSRDPTSVSRAALGLFAVLCAATVAACGGGDDSSAPPGDSSGVVFASSFQGFRSWTSYHFDQPTAQGVVHAAGPRTEYIKALPPKGSTSFPVGTLIVKTLETGDRQIFAMVKRGAGYNAGGAIGWEWFELKEADDGTVAIIWRGVGPPSGEKYGGDPSGGCNGCHAAARANDFVQSPKIVLGSL